MRSPLRLNESGTDWSAVERSQGTQATKSPDENGRVAVSLVVNDQPHTLRVSTEETLLDVLRDQLKLFGVRYGCGVGVCGACTVIRNSRAVSSCLVLAALCENDRIRTVESLESDGYLDQIQETFLEHRAFQCSYCTPGFIMALKALLEREVHPTEESLREAFTGHICRCGSYSRILKAALHLIDNDE